MSQFAQALQSFRSGRSTRDQLLAALDQELSAQQTAPRTLLAILDTEHCAAALPTEIRSAVADRITSWQQDDTLLLGQAANTGPEVENPQTILLSQSRSRAEPTPEATRSAAPGADVGVVLQGRFKLVERIGEGGMSRVYKAIDLRRVEARSPNPFLAVKVLTVPFDHYFGSIQALGREADKLRSLTHPNIVRVIDVDRDGETVFMTMEFLSGESLHDKLKPAKAATLSAEQRYRIVEAIARALDFAHSTGIVHGDLKPGNVIITDAGEVKVIDFGIARFFARPKESAVDAKPDGKHWEAISALTLPYASPEMIEDHEPDPRDDVYALACIAHEVMTGRHPFARCAATLARDSGSEVVPNPAINSTQFKAIVRGLRFERRDRTPSAQAFIDDFSGRRQPRRGHVMTVAAVVALAVIGAVYLNGSRKETAAPVAQAPRLTAGQVFRDCATCPLMRVLPPGTVLQGSMSHASEQPLRQVAIAAPIAFAPREITIGEFEEFADDTRLQTRGCNVHDGEWRWRDDVNWESLDDGRTTTHPVGCVSWDDAVAYAAWLSKKTGQSYRLPSASEWEYAASAGVSPATPLVDDVAAACKQANVADQAAAGQYPGWNVLACNDRYVQSAPVGSFAPNAFGLHDMIGNMFEWVGDCWSDSYQGAPTDGSARRDGDCGSREMRGGSWFTAPEFLRASYRNYFEHDYRSSSVGFRIVREIHQ
jgi:formylglycine-generating enzyme required for sulfatase activity/predicted Ser/Thr protein kinase